MRREPLAQADWQDLADTMDGGTGLVIRTTFDTVNCGSLLNVRFTLAQAKALVQALQGAIDKSPVEVKE